MQTFLPVTGHCVGDLFIMFTLEGARIFVSDQGFAVQCNGEDGHHLSKFAVDVLKTLTIVCQEC